MAIADMSTFLVRRDAEGKVVPYEVGLVVSESDDPPRILILPTTIGSMKGLSDPYGESSDWPVEEKIRYVREHVVSPDFSALTPDEIMDQMTVFDLDVLLVTAIQHGGPLRQKPENGKRPTLPGQRKRKSRQSKRTSTK